MCAQFTLKINANKLSLLYGITVSEDFNFDSRVLPHQNSLVIFKIPRELHSMRFSLLPSWSKESKVKFATHNARLETLTEKPTWKKPFQSQRCLVPMSEFIEPIYENEYAGHMVRFSELDHNILTAAGLYDTWMNKETGEIIESFAIITGEPPRFIAQIGHDRCPIFLKPQAWEEWLDPKSINTKALTHLLLNATQTVNFQVTKDRALKPGWEKRK